MTTIPEIQDRLHAIAEEIRHPLLFPRTLDDISAELHHLTTQLSRRRAVRRAPPVSRLATKQLREQLKREALAHPDLTYQAIAERHGVTAGRVSEAVAGKRR